MFKEKNVREIAKMSTFIDRTKFIYSINACQNFLEIQRRKCLYNCFIKHKIYSFYLICNAFVVLLSFFLKLPSKSLFFQTTITIDQIYIHFYQKRIFLPLSTIKDFELSKNLTLSDDCISIIKVNMKLISSENLFIKRDLIRVIYF